MTTTTTMTTMTTTVLPVRIRSYATNAARRLLASEPLNYEAHCAVYGGLSYLDGEQIILAAELAGLRGHGGAAFPTHRKLSAVREAARRGRRRAVVVANGSEGEPASAKDKTLMSLAPHLVLDGLALAAAAVGADRAFLTVEAGHGLGRYLTEVSRQRPAPTVPVTIVEVPQRFLSGQETALVSFLDGGAARPRFQIRPVYEHGVGGAPTLVQNVETLAHLALIARHGPGWYRAGAATSLFTVRHADGTPTVVEAMPSTPVRQLVNTDTDTVPHPGSSQAVLIGGYHGTWLPWADAASSSLETLGVPLGAGMLAVLPHDRCGLIETASILRYPALESAGQCGPCLNGLPRMASAFAELAHPTPRTDFRQIHTDLSRWAGLITGRGACRHPDGSARLAHSALTTFAREADAHARGRCTAPGRPPMLPVGK
ncbi:NADH:ubiquinone oxidoreductase subunit F (NADH-binding) [Catenulispora sp. MAP12-49]|uniref:NADH-ubiquinone oxidoreductase-F iron-sulfur binding region domain-containing protein n=1 Tax=unclassified Catenulispora TaxID=414885 RepID=UPI0035172DA1